MKYLNIKKTLAAWQNLQPLSEKDRDRLSRRFTVDFNYNSNHIEGNTLTYGQTEILLLFGKVIGEADVRDVQEMTASNVGLRMMSEEAAVKEVPLTQNFIRTLHKTLLREDYTVNRELPGGIQTSYVIHAGQYKTRPNSVITRYGGRFEYASPEETPSLMTDLVDWYNKAEQKGKLSPVELAALFIFLNRTCFNGLYRVNAKGEYNVPMGIYKNPNICDEDNLRKVAKALDRVTIKCADYKESASFIDKHTFVYFDPPYRPLPSSVSFTAYTERDFDDEHQIELGYYIKKLTERGVYVLASNSDPKNTDPEDNFFDELYSGMKIKRIYASRMINSNASARGRISELLICSNEETKE